MANIAYLCGGRSVESASTLCAKDPNSNAPKTDFYLLDSIIGFPINQ